MRLPTASALDRAIACPASCVLPASYTTGADAETGTAIHEFVAAARAGAEAREAALAAIADDDVRDRCEAIDLSRIPAGAESEVALAWDDVSDCAVRLAVPRARAYPATDAWYGTADLVGRLPDRRVWVADLKSGRAPRAADSMQLKMLALAAARLTGASEAVVAMVSIRHDGRLAWDQADLDAWQLEETAAALRDLRRRIADAADAHPPATRAGSHCRYCPAVPYCPAQTALVRHFATLDLETIDARIAEMTTDEAGQLYERVEMVLAVAERAKSVLRDRAAREPLPLPDGRVLGPVPWTSRTIDNAIALRVIRERFGDEALTAAAGVTWKGMEAAARLLGIKPLRAVADAVREAGGLSERKTTRIAVGRGQP